MSDTLSDSIQKAYEELSALPRDEFMRRLEEHKDGWIANMLIETGAIKLINIKMIADKVTRQVEREMRHVEKMADEYANGGKGG